MNSLRSRLLSAILAAVLVFALLPATAIGGDPESAPSEIETGDAIPLSFGAQAVRAQGLDRLGTSVAISQLGWQSADWVVIATSQNFPDALVAGPLAAALDAPVLLTPGGGLTPEVAAEVTRLGATNAVLVGGVHALAPQVVADLVAAGVPEANIERMAGANRYETAQLVAMRLDGIVGDVQTVVLVTGADFPDALSVSGLAGANGVPILLTSPSELCEPASQAMTDLGAIGTLVIGGESAVSSDVATLTPHPTRVGGTNRYDTARLVAEYAFACGFTYDSVIVARGTDFPDALCAGPYAARLGAPVVLTDGVLLSLATDEFFNAHCTSIQHIVIIGGTGAISAEVESAIEAAATTEISPETVVVGAAVSDEIESIAPDGSLIVFSAGSPEVASIETSQVLVSAPTAAAPQGFLVRVVGVTEAGGKVSVETTQATLEDIIVKGSLDVTGTVDPNREPATASDVIVSDAHAVDDTHVDLSFETIERDSGSPTEVGPVIETAGFTPPAGEGAISPQEAMGGTTMSFSAELGPAGEDKAVDAGVSSALSIDGSITFNGGFTFNAYWGHLYYRYHWWGRESVTGLQNITFTTYLSEYLVLDMSYVRSASFEVDIVKLLEQRLRKEFSWRIGSVTVWIGWIPVYIQFDLEPVFTVGGSVSGSVGAEFAQYSSVTFGIRYDYGVGWRPIRGSSNSFSITPSIGAGADVGVDIGAKVSAKFYGIVGPYFGVTGGLGIEADLLEDPWWTAGVSVDGIFGAEFSVFGQGASLNGSVNFWERDIAAANGPFPAGGIVWWPSAAAMPEGVSAAAFAGPANVPPPAPQPLEPLAVLDVDIDTSTLDRQDFSIGGLDVLDAQVLPDGTTVRLTTSPQSRGADYVVAQRFEGFRTVDGAWATSASRPFVGYAPPRVIYAAANVDDRVAVVFESHRPIDPVSVAAADFAIPGVSVLDAVVDADGQTVVLTTSAQTPGAVYPLAVVAGGVSDGEFECEAEASSFTGFANYTVASTSLNHSTSSIFEIRSPDGITAYAVGMSGVVSKTTNGGTTWTRVGNIAPTFAMNTAVGNSYDLAFPGQNPARPVAPVYLGVIARSTDGGTTWSYWDNNAVTERHGINIDFASATRGIGVVGGQLLVTNDGGATWARHAQDTSVSGINVRFAPADLTRGYICAAGGVMYRSDDSGTTWSRTSPTGVTVDLAKVGISPSDPDTLIVAGAGATILRSEDGGATWTSVDSGQDRDVHEVSWADDHVVFVSGQEGAIVVSRDAGRTWSVVRAPWAGGPYVSGLWARDGANAWCGGLNAQAWKITGN